MRNFAILRKISLFVTIMVCSLIIAGKGFSQESRNPFKDWFPVIKVEPPPQPTEERPIVVEPERRYFDVAMYNVDGIIWGAYKPRAIINNEIYGVGDRLGEAEIKKISKEGVILTFKEEEYVIAPKKAIEVKKSEEEIEGNITGGMYDKY